MVSSHSVPTYRKHKSSGQAVITVCLPDGRRHDVYLGCFKSAESRREYSRIVAELAVGAAPESAARIDKILDLTVNEILDHPLTHARQHYRRADGSQTYEIVEYLTVFGVLKRLYLLDTAGFLLDHLR